MAALHDLSSIDLRTSLGDTFRIHFGNKVYDMIMTSVSPGLQGDGKHERVTKTLTIEFMEVDR